jgi:hypothetical protein
MRLSLQSRSRAWRPAYQPQFPHTTWGCFPALQRGQLLRAGALRVQFEARRLRLLAFEVFFFGTAIVRLCFGGDRAAGTGPIWRDPGRTTAPRERSC